MKIRVPPLYIYQSILQIENPKNNILKECYRKGLINILQRYYKFDKTFIINDAIKITSENDHVEILEWFKNSRFGI